MYGKNAWNRICKVTGKSEIKCHKRWLELNDKSDMAIASWTKEEDDLLAKRVTEKGAKDWT